MAVNGQDAGMKNKDVKSVNDNQLRKWELGIKLAQQFNYPALHTDLLFSIYLKNHNIYFGPEYTLLMKNLYGDPVDEWDKEYLGVALGYRYIINSTLRKLNFFVSTNFSFYQVKYEEYQLGPPNQTSHYDFVVENTAGFGLNYCISKGILIYGEIGIGSTSGFFLMINEFIPHAGIGLEIKLK